MSRPSTSPSPKDETELELVGDFIQNLGDYADIHEDISPRDHLRIKFELAQQLRELGEAGFAVYSGHTQRILEVDGRREPWPGQLYKIVRLEEWESTGGRSCRPPLHSQAVNQSGSSVNAPAFGDSGRP